mgnify:CR=1 FL=1
MTSNTLPTLFSYAPSQVPIFEGVHYEYWSNQMETFFLSQNLWDVVEDGYAEPPESASSSDWTPAHQQQYKENIQRNATALRYIQQGVSKSIFSQNF